MDADDWPAMTSLLIVMHAEKKHRVIACCAQDAFNLLPNLNMHELTRSFAVKSNDMMLVIYLSSLIRSVLALHDLIENREIHQIRERKADEAAAAEQKAAADAAATEKAGDKKAEGEDANMQDAAENGGF